MQGLLEVKHVKVLKSLVVNTLVMFMHQLQSTMETNLDCLFQTAANYLSSSRISKKLTNDAKLEVND